MPTPSWGRAAELGLSLVLVLLVVGQTAGVLFLSPAVVLVLGVVVWLLDALLPRVAVRSFRRGEILARQ